MHYTVNSLEDLTILYQDPYLVAVNKPPGLLVHRSPVDRREKIAALQIVRDQVGCHVYPVHRLDRPTAGVLLFAKNPGVANQVSQAFQSRSVEKRYLAVVRGYIPESGTIDHPVKEVIDRRLSAAENVAVNRYPSLTRYRRLAEVELSISVDRYPTTRYSLVELRPVTGRRHQLRLHMRHISHPIIGDTRYGQGAHNHFFRERFGCRNLLLCARELILSHPASGERVAIVAPFHPSFQRILLAFGWDSQGL